MFKWLKKLYVDPEFRRKEEFLRRVSLFNGIHRREYGKLFQALVTRDYNAGEALFSEGEVGRALFILESGDVDITHNGKDGKPRHVTTLKAGDFFGEIALVDHLPRIATAKAIGPVRAHLLYKTELEKLAEHSPRIALAIMTHGVAILGDRMRELMSRIPSEDGVK
jgi:CRP-like cAMP-binding protein